MDKSKNPFTKYIAIGPIQAPAKVKGSKFVDPYTGICKYRGCGEPYPKNRTDQQYCCKDHYKKEKSAREKERRDRGKHMTKAMVDTDMNLEKFFDMGKIRLPEVDLLMGGWDPQAPFIPFWDEHRGQYILRYIDFGLMKLDEDNKYQIICLRGSKLKTIPCIPIPYLRYLTDLRLLPRK